MFTNTSFGKTMDLMHRSMDVELLRRSVIADNIANADTPGFKRTVVNFESQLKQALRPKRDTFLSVETPWRSGHIDYKDVRPSRELDFTTLSDNNGNNVDAEQEIMSAVQNQMRYNLMTHGVTSQFQQINYAIRQI